MKYREYLRSFYSILWFAVCCFYADSQLQHGGNATAYYVNMDISKDRRTFMHNQLASLNFTAVRIAAITGPEVPNRVKVLMKDMYKLRELACTMSHLSAWYDGKSAQKDSNYALILEDDVSFEMDFDLEKLIASAPSDFAILQLTTSNAAEVRNLWQQYVAEVNVTGNKNAALWRVHRPCHSFWSTQAYVINKKMIKSALDRTVKNQKGVLAFELGPPDGFRNDSSCRHRLVADVHLYAMGKTYVTRVPLLNGHSNVGRQSLIRNDAAKNSLQIRSFMKIDEVFSLVGQNVDLLPPFIQPMSRGNISKDNVQQDAELQQLNQQLKQQQEQQRQQQQRQQQLQQLHPDTMGHEMVLEKDRKKMQQQQHQQIRLNQDHNARVHHRQGIQRTQRAGNP